MRPTAFPAAPFGAGDIAWRGSLETVGKFYINQNWQYGWNITVLSDRSTSTTIGSLRSNPPDTIFRTSSPPPGCAVRRGRGFFDLSGYHFQTETAYVDSARIRTPYRCWTITAPLRSIRTIATASAARRRGVERGKHHPHRGALSIGGDTAVRQSLGVMSTCTNYQPGTASTDCLLRGIARIIARHGEFSWQRRIVDPIGEVGRRSRSPASPESRPS